MTNNQFRVLLFDDDFDSMRYLQQYLEETFTWDVELTAEQSILTRLKHERFNLIIVDSMIQPTSKNHVGLDVTNVHFDGINWQGTGLEFIHRLRTGEFASSQGTPADVPIILLSAIADGALTSTDNDFLTSLKVIEKPFRLDKLVEEIQSIL